MRNRKILFFFVALSLMIRGNCYAAQAPDTLEMKQPKANLDIDKFRENLKEVAQNNLTNESANAATDRQMKTLDDKYVLAPGDSIAMEVWGEPEFSQKDILIRPDGFITIDPFGEVKASGLTVAAFTDQLNGKFSYYLKDPKISISINNYKTAKVYVYGAVNRSGLYQQEKNLLPTAAGTMVPTSGDLTVASVIAGSGGLKHNADIKHVIVTNNYSKKQREVDLSKLINEGDASQDIFLSSGDTVYVPYINTSAQISDSDYQLLAGSSLVAPTFKVRVIGEVMKPGLYDIASGVPGISSAVSAAEGFTPLANKKVIKIIRKTPNGNEATIFTTADKPEVLLRPDDIVEVAMKGSAKASRVGTFFGDIFAPVARLADACNGFADLADPGRRYKDYWKYRGY